jgi:hypothetical protein
MPARVMFLTAERRKSCSNTETPATAHILPHETRKSNTGSRPYVKTKSSRSRLPARGLKTLVGTKPASGDVRNIPISAYAKTCAPRFYSEEGNRWLRNTSGLGKPTSIDMLRAIQGERKLTEGQEVEFEFGAHGGKRASCSEFSVGCKNPQPAARFHLSTFARI